MKKSTKKFCINIEFTSNFPDTSSTEKVASHKEMNRQAPDLVLCWRQNHRSVLMSLNIPVHNIKFQFNCNNFTN